MKTRTHHLLPQVARLYPFDLHTLILIRSSEFSPNDIYAFKKDGKEYILRVATHTADHTGQMTAEMEWLRFLHDRQVRVSMPLPMSDGRLVSSIQHQDKYHTICAFEKASGRHCDKTDADTWNARVFAGWGHTMGRIHHETKTFEPIHRRGVFDGNDGLSDSLNHIPHMQRLAQAFVKELISIPQHRDNYGLIHYDFHPNNFIVDNSVVNVFDFDDSLYGYFALDIGIALYHALLNGLPDAFHERQDAAKHIICAFMRGYREANTLAPCDLLSIPSFMRFRQLCNFGWAYQPHTNEMPEVQDNLQNGIIIPGCSLEDRWFLT